LLQTRLENVGRMIILKDKILVHVPKAGGTAVLTAFGINRWHNGISQTSIAKLYETDKVETHTPAKDKPVDLPTYAFVRNPWTRTVSRYHYCKKHHKLDCPFIQFVEEKIVSEEYKWGPTSWQQQVEWLEDSTVIMKMEEGLEYHLEHTLGHKLSVPIFNSSNIDNYNSYFNNRTKNLIGDYYKDDIERFNY